MTVIDTSLGAPFAGMPVGRASWAGASAGVRGMPAHARPGARTRVFRRIMEGSEDVVLLVLAVFLLPLTIFLVGAPIALFVRALMAIVERL